MNNNGTDQTAQMLSACRSLKFLATYWVHSDDSDQIGYPGWSESSLGTQSFCWFCHKAAHFRIFLLYFNGLSHPADFPSVSGVCLLDSSDAETCYLDIWARALENKLENVFVKHNAPNHMFAPKYSIIKILWNLSKNWSGHLHLGHSKYAWYHDPSSSGSPVILFTRVMPREVIQPNIYRILPTFYQFIYTLDTICMPNYIMILYGLNA